MASKRKLHCPRCNSELIPAESFSGGPCEFWMKCSECRTFVNTYEPQPHQKAVHLDCHVYKGNFGAYGTGKTITSRQEVVKHAMLIPNAYVLIGAEETAQYEQTIKTELEKDLPVDFVAGHSTRYNYIDLKNGSRIAFRPLADVNQLRSYNVTMFVIIEASNTKAEAFHQLKTRLRNAAALRYELDEYGDIVYKKYPDGTVAPVVKIDCRQGIVESNPDSGWIRSDVLLVSDKIYKHGKVPDNYSQLPSEIDKAVCSHVASTDVNKYLPPTFKAELAKNKPAWWVARYLQGSFSYAEGLVYPHALKAPIVCPTFEVPANWKRFVAHDYGLSDPARFLWAALDLGNNLLYFYREDHTDDKSVDDLAQVFYSGAADVPIGGFALPPIIDPKSGPKRDYNKKTLIDLYAEHGILFTPGQVSVDARVFRTNTYIESQKIRIMDCCEYLIKELREYKFPEKTLNQKRRNADKPVDKNNHSINCMEWILMELPANPDELQGGVYDSMGRRIQQTQAADTYQHHALSDNRYENYGGLTINGGTEW